VKHLDTDFLARLHKSAATTFHMRLEGYASTACIVCGCTDEIACEGGCWWAEIPPWPLDLLENLPDGSVCSACVAAVGDSTEPDEVILRIREKLVSGED
jgi:hypothetical protein